MSLEASAEGIAWRLAVWLRAFYDADVPIEKAGDLSLELSAQLRALAIIGLLSIGDPKQFRKNLVQSADVRRSYLERLKSLGITTDHHQASGRVAPLLDAVAGGDGALALKIVALSPADFQRGREYQDDYCFAQIIHGLLSQPKDVSRLTLLADEFETYLEGRADPRLPLCRALVDRNQTVFDQSFAALLDARDQEIEGAKARGQLEDPIVDNQRLVYVEGLALLALADMRGLATEDEYRFCPSLARGR